MSRQGIKYQDNLNQARRVEALLPLGGAVDDVDDADVILPAKRASTDDGIGYNIRSISPKRSEGSESESEDEAKARPEPLFTHSRIYLVLFTILTFFLTTTTGDCLVIRFHLQQGRRVICSKLRIASCFPHWSARYVIYCMFK